MAGERRRVREAVVGKLAVEVGQLAARGVRCGGNACSELVFLCGEDRGGEGAPDPLGNPARTALRASLDRLGYPPECWEWLLATTPEGPLAPALLREALCALDPATVAIVDGKGRGAFANAYAAELSALADTDAALLVPGVPADVLGMRVMYLGDFASGLADGREKQRLWHRLKRLRPLGQPY